MHSPYTLDPKSGLARLSCGLMLASLALRLAAYLLLPGGVGLFHIISQIAVPALCNVLFVVIVCKGGDRAPTALILPVALGVAFFIIKAADFMWWHQLLCTLLYLLVAVLFIMTVTGRIPGKTLLTLVFALPLLFHIAEDLYNALRGAPHMDARAWLLEGSVLCIMAALLCLTLALSPRDDAQIDR